MCWNHLIWCCFHGENCKKQKKTRCFSKCSTSYLHNRSTLEHHSNRFWKLQCRATTFVFLPFWEIGHVTTLPMTHQMDPDIYHDFCFGFFHFLVIFNNISFFWVYSMDPDGSTWHSIYHFYLFIFDFLAILTAIKYLLKVPGIHMKSTMKYPGG